MTYAMKLEDHHKLMYSDNVQMVAQQMRNPLMGAVTEFPCSGEAHSVVDLFGSVEYKRGERRSRRNPENPIEGSRRWVVHQLDLESGQYVDREDKLRSAMDPTSNLMRGHVAAVTRGWADTILGVSKQDDGWFKVTEGGILGGARAGKTPGAAADLPAGQYIDADATGMTLEKLILAVERLNLADFGLEDEDPLYCVISPKQKTDLLNIAAATGTNLNQFELEQIRTGRPTTLMGITWIQTNRVPHKTKTGPRLCPVFSKRNIVAGVWQGIQGAMWNDPHAKNLPYMLVTANLDCVRAEDKGVVVIECAES